ncbi:MAG TPA: glucose-6-phosphate isomerase, partial [Pseudodesulfovibrio sp.]|nr:glucose-6-phosphate isomerase [Pseudodesulfovibrio sp.]
MADILDWTNADLDRLDMATYEKQAEDLAARLRDETGAGKLPFLTMPYAAELKKQLAGLSGYLDGFEHMLLLGIGGSALGARALQKAFYPKQDRPGH